MRYECFKLKNGVNRYKSYCPTQVDPATMLPVEGSVEECYSHSCPLAKYHTHREVVEDLNELSSSEYFDVAETFSLGSSQLGEPLYGIRLSESVSNVNRSRMVR